MKKREPKRIFELFDEISKIPRCTGDEDKIASYIVAFAEELKLEVSRDTRGNVIVKKDGTPGYETSAPIILQGHMDMLCIKAKGCEHDFAVAGPSAHLSGDLIVADGTSLGSDNGIALAFYLAVLESQTVVHPPLEVVFTVQEQAGLVGARDLDIRGLLGRYLINMDSEAEGEFIIGCAGEKRLHVELPVEPVEQENDVEAVIRISGLRGGHSGMDIHLNRGNACQILSRMYYEITECMDADLISMRAGDKFNVIPNSGELVMALPHDAVVSLKEYLGRHREVLETTLNEEEFDIELEICPIKAERKVLSKASALRAVSLVLTMPNGVIQLSERESELIDTSLNIGILHVDLERAEIMVSVRGMTEERLDQTVSRMRILADLAGASMEIVNAYPAWKDDGENHLRRKFERVYKALYGQEPVLRSVHAGLECSILAKKLNERKLQPKIEMISFGPDIFDAHTPQEALSVSSVQRTWTLFLQILKELNE